MERLQKYLDLLAVQQILIHSISSSTLDAMNFHKRDLLNASGQEFLKISSFRVACLCVYSIKETLVTSQLDLGYNING